tara:strand:- start:7287 stop:8027 length:741 start_codon:yes stop_codon:yes gene_type:complete
MSKLEGQIAIVTGGSRGIGEGICEVFCREGATVIIWDILDGSDTVDRISKLGGNIIYQQVDVTSLKSVDQALNEIIKKYKKVEILINNAGIIRDKSFLKMSEAEWDDVINVNLKSLYIVTRSIIPYMKENGYGRIVSASSINGTAGAFGQTNYCATKAGISGFTRALCKEVGKYGITANAVAPGFIKSVMTDSMPEEVIKAGISMIPVGRIGTPEDMGQAYLFLASKEAGFINGITLHANGGAMPL